jgi:hypothetical protein
MPKIPGIGNRVCPLLVIICFKNIFKRVSTAC